MKYECGPPLCRPLKHSMICAPNFKLQIASDLKSLILNRSNVPQIVHVKEGSNPASPTGLFSISVGDRFAPPPTKPWPDHHQTIPQ